MFLVLSLTASGSVLALVVLWLRKRWWSRVAGVERWLWLIVLLRLCVPLPGPVNLMGEAFLQIQGGVRFLYASAEEEWLLDRDKGHEAFFAEIQQAADAAPEDVDRLPFGSYTPEVPARITLPGWFRIINPNTWLAIWGIGAVVRFCWSLFRGKKRPLRFHWFAEAVLSLHWFNPLMLPVRRALAEPPADAPAGRWGRWVMAALAAAGLCLGVLPGGACTDLFRGADQFVFDLNAVSITGKDALDRFMEKTERGHPAFLRVVKLFEADPQFSIPAYIWIYDVYFDGEQYHSFEPGGSSESPYQQVSYPYIVREEREITTNEEIDRAVSYTLTDNPHATWYDRLQQVNRIPVDQPIMRYTTLINYYIYKEQTG